MDKSNYATSNLRWREYYSRRHELDVIDDKIRRVPIVSVDDPALVYAGVQARSTGSKSPKPKPIWQPTNECPRNKKRKINKRMPSRSWFSTRSCPLVFSGMSVIDCASTQDLTHRFIYFEYQITKQAHGIKI